MKNLSAAFLLIATVVVTFNVSSCKKDADLTCSISTPAVGSAFEIGTHIAIEATANNGTSTVSEVVFFVDDEEIGRVDAAPYELSWSTTGLTAGDYVIKATATGEGKKTVSDEVTVTLKNEPVYSWSAVGEFSGPGRRGAVGFSINGKGYVGLGEGSGSLQDFHEYDPGTDQWTKLDDFAGEKRFKAIAFVIDGFAYVGLGKSSADRALKDLWKYDPTQKNWTQLNDFPASEGTDNCQAFEIDGSAFVLLEKTRSFYEYNVSNDSWVEVSAFPGASREGGTSFAVNSSAYYGFGRTNMTSYFSDLWKYDPAEDLWSNVGSHAERGTWQGIGFALGIKGFYGLGSKDVYDRDDFWIYDPAGGSSKFSSIYPGGKGYHQVSFVIGNNAYVGLGSSSVGGKEFYRFEAKY